MVNKRLKYVKNESVMGNVIKNIQTILFPLAEYYWMLTNKCCENSLERVSLPDGFRDHCIAIIFSGFTGGKKDRDALIRGLNKYNTISEMYKYLVDQLWENAATEVLIRRKVQMRIRNYKNVYHYYDELFSFLKNSHFINDVQRIVYKNIFDKASELFILNNQIHKLS